MLDAVSSDRDFLERVHRVWVLLFVFCCSPILFLLNQIWSGRVDLVLISQLIILAVSLVVPIIVWTAAGSVSRKFLSLNILVIAAVTDIVFWLWLGLWYSLFRSTNPSLGGYANFGWIMGLIDAATILGASAYINKWLLQYFLSNLKTKANLNQLPHLKVLLKQTIRICFVYWFVAQIAFYYIFLPSP